MSGRSRRPHPFRPQQQQPPQGAPGLQDPLEQYIRAKTQIRSQMLATVLPALCGNALLPDLLDRMDPDHEGPLDVIHLTVDLAVNIANEAAERVINPPKQAEEPKEVITDGPTP